MTEKEMTPKEALRRISGFISFGCYKYFDKELEKDWKKDIDAIKQALDRLEQLEIADRNNQNLVKTNVDLVNKNLELQKENQELKEEIQDLKDNETIVADYGIVLWNENEKSKKVIDILKNKANIRLHILKNTDGSKIYEIEFILGYYSTIHEITQQEYDLLKEVLENV